MSSGSASTAYPTNVLSGLWSGNNNNFSPTPYPNTSGAANNAYSGTGNLSGMSGSDNLNQATPNYFATGNNAQQTYQNTGQNLFNNNANLGQNLYNSNTQQGQNLYNSATQSTPGLQQQASAVANQTMPYAQSALQQGSANMDAQYAQQYQQTMDQANAVNAANGVATTPYGAGLAQQAGTNFNLGWQEQMLQRQQTAANTAATLYGAGTNAIGTNYGLTNQAQSIGTNAALSGASTGTNAALSGLSTGTSGLLNAYGQGSTAQQNMYNSGQTQQGTNQAQANYQQQTGLNAQQQQITDYLNYLSGSSGNALNLANANNSAYNASNSLYGTTAQSAATNQANTSSAYSGLGNLFGQGLSYFGL